MRGEKRFADDEACRPGRWRRFGGPVVFAALLLAACLERGSDDRARARSKPAAPPAPAALPKLAAKLSPPGPADPKATIRVRLEAEPAHLNPLLAGDAIAERLVLGDVYQGLLCAPRPDARAEPCLATALDVSDDGRRWRFSLRDGVRWHDGEAFTAADVVFTYELLRDAPTTLAADFADLEAVTARGKAVELRFAGARADRRAAIARVPILPAHRFADVVPARLGSAPASRAPIGTGPLRFVSWKPGESISLARFDDYWGAASRAERVVHRVMPSRERAIAELAGGTLDVALRVPVDEALAAVRDHPELRAFTRTQPAYLSAVMSWRTPALQTAKARRALIASLDRRAIDRELFAGRGALVTGPYLGGDGDPEVAPIEHAPELAREILAGATLRLAVPAGSRTAERIADIWAADVRGAVELEVERVAYADLLANVRAGDFDVAILGFTTGPEVDVHHRFHSSQIGGDNVGAVRDARLDRALEAARDATTAEARAAARRAVHRRLAEIGAEAFLFADLRVGLARADVGGAGDGATEWGARALWKSR